MNKRVGVIFLFLPVLLSLGRTPERRGGQVVAPQKGVNWLEALVLADSFRDAEKLAADVLADPATDARTRAVCGLAFLKAGRVEEAESIFRKVISLSPDNPEAHLGLGWIARIRNDPEAAMEHLRRAIPSRAFFEEALRQLWRTARDRGLVSELLEIYKTAEERYGRESKPLPSWFTNGLAQVQGLIGKRLFEMEGRFEHLTVPLVTNVDPGSASGWSLSSSTGEANISSISIRLRPTS